MRNLRRGLKALLAFCMCVSTITVTSTSVFAAGDVTIVDNGNTVVIGNEYISREFSTKDDKLTTNVITNKRTDGTHTLLVPESGTEEFVLGLLPAKFAALDKSGWTAVADSYQTNEVNGDGPASNLIDGKVNTIWHSRYNNSGVAGDMTYPHSVIFTFDGEETFKSFSYTGRTNGTNGHIKDYKLYANTTDTKLDFNAADSAWTLISEGTFNYNGSTVVYVNLDKECTATQLKLVAVNEVEGRAFASGAEFDLHADAFEAPKSSTIAASDLALDGEPVIDTVEKDGKTGKTLTFKFKPYNYAGIEYSISEIVTMYDGDSFMRKHLDISVPTEQAADAKISYIDLENMNFSEDDLKENEFWSIPEQANNSDMAGMKGDFLELGQPYYIAAMYFGSEFPQTENKIREGNGYIRYWYGKSLAKDPHFEYNLNNTAGEMETWPAIVGAARSRDYLVCQADFYEYIETIATPTDFRQQYNSWYDLMKNISAENIKDSFYEIEKGFTQYGVNPLDSYVIDDGWMNYSSFWDFNNKFPNELYDSSLQVQSLGSNFGLWLGPRGGYGTQTQIANWIANNGLGSVNSNSGNDINISDARYLNKLLSDIFVGYQEKFDINYWKLDGMLLHPSTTESEYYVTGNPFYTISETYERWTDMFEKMREQRDGKDLWLNLTSYLNPSPWYLQWVNSVWMQNTGDTGYTQKYNSTDAEQTLTYRDGAYYNFIFERQWQLPNKYFYNHDPVYGSTAHSSYKPNQISFTTDEMRDYLYMLGTRGTAFWEYYYSYSMFDDDKWQVNAEAAEWIESNFDILQKSKMFSAGNPRDGKVYGYSCWNGNEGIVSIRNPLDQKQTYELTFDRLVGVSEGMENVKGKVIVGDLKWQTEELEVSYGETVTYELEPKEVLIVQYGETDTTAATIESIHGSEKTIEVEFNEAIREPQVSDITVEGNTVTAVELKADKRTVKVTVENELIDAANFTVNVDGVKDTVGNVTKASATDDYYAGDVVTTLANKTFNNSPINKGSEASIDGSNDFAVSGKFATSAHGGTLVKQDGAFTISIDEEGYLEFDVNGVKANSKYLEKIIENDEVIGTVKGLVADGNEHTFAAVKEVNGMIKLYVDGLLVKSGYDAAKKDMALAKGDIIFGENYVGTLKDVTVYDKALAYDEVETIGNQGTAGSKIDLTADMLSASSIDTTEAGVNKSLANLLDGNEETFWATHPTEDTSLEETWLQVDLGSLKTIDKMELGIRHHVTEGYNCTGNINDYIISVSTDGETWKEVAKGEMSKDGLTEITFEPVEAQYIKVTATSSYHWQDGTNGRPDNRNKVMCLSEVAVYEYQEPVLEPEDDSKDVKFEEILSITDGDHHEGDASQGAASSFIYDGKEGTMWHTDWYPQSGEGRGNFYVIFQLKELLNIDGMRFLQRTDNSPNGKVTKFEIYVSAEEEALAADSNKWVKVVENGTLEEVAEWQRVNFDAVQARQVKFVVLDSTGDQPNKVFASMAEARLTKTAKEGGIVTPPETPVTKDALNAEIEAVENTEADDYTEESYAVFAEALAQAKAVAVKVDATQEEVDAALAALTEAYAALKETQPIVADKSALAVVYNEVKGTEKGNYTDETYNAFKEALAKAEAVLRNADATQEEVDAALADLQAAVEGLKEVEKPAEKPFPFTDVSNKQWYYGVINEAYQLGLMTGASDSLFKPNANMNRGMVAIVFHRMEGSKKVEYSKVFPDVANKQYYTTSVLWAKQTGVINGYKDGTFKPLRNVSREEMATMIYNFARYKGLDMSASKDITYFSDYAKITPYARVTLQWAVEKGLMSGKYNGTRLDPLGTATRAECSKMLVQAYKVIYK